MSTLSRLSLVVVLAVVVSAFGENSYGQEESDLTPKRTTTASKPRVRLQAIGMLSASNVYTTYGYIGMITDGVVRKGVSGEKAGQLLAEVIRLLEMNSAMLKTVEESGVPKSDVATLKQTAEIYRLLKTQAEAGMAFAKSPTAVNAREFESARTIAWSQIAKLLGINKQSSIR